MPQHIPSDEFRHRVSQVRTRTVFDLYQQTIAVGMLVYAMDDADKFRLVARSLRERAIVPEMAFRRKEVIGLAARFEVLAIEADHIQEHLVDTLFAPHAMPSSPPQSPNSVSASDLAMISASSSLGS